MTEPVTDIRNRLIESLSYHGIGTNLEISLSEAANFGLMNGGMIVRATGLYLELVEDESAGPLATEEQRKHLVGASISIADHVASQTDRQGNEAMAEMFGPCFVDSLRLIKRLHRIWESPYDDGGYAREVTQTDWDLANMLDAHMAKTGASYLGTVKGQLLMNSPAVSVPDQGCPLRHGNEQNPQELENVIKSLVSEYLDPTSESYGIAYPGIASYAVIAASTTQPRDPDSADHRIDWQLPMPTNQQITV